MDGLDQTADGELRFITHVPLLQLFLAVTVGGAFLFFCLGLPRLNDEEPGALEWFMVSCVTPMAVAMAGFRRSLVVDRARGEVRRRMGWFCIQRRQRFPLAAYDRVEIRSSTVDHDAHRPHGERRLSARDTSYPVYLAGEGGAELMLTTNASHATSLQAATAIAAALALTCADTVAPRA